MTNNPTNIILLAALAVGGYWLYTQQQRAQYVAPRPGAPRPGTTTTDRVSSGLNALTAGTRLLSGLFGGGTAPAGAQSRAERIANDDVPGQPGYGWSYFTDGTAISPTGTYYSNGVPVWSPETVFNPPGNVSAYDWQQSNDLYLG